MNLKTISRNVGYALLVSALFMLFSVIVSVANGNDSALAALLISFFITFTIGIFPFIFVKKTAAITMKDGYMIIVLSWLLSFVVGMLPYALWGGPFSIQNAWFESVSGFTTTGATILDNIEAVPRSLLFWRSSTHFIGGLGVVVFLLLVIPNSSPVRLRLTNMELSSLSKEGYSTNANKVVYIFAYVYFGLVIVSFFAYWAAGMSAFDAINHAFSVSATGGFSTRNQSIGSFDSYLIEGLTMLFMFISSLHFGLVYFSIITLSQAAQQSGREVIHRHAPVLQSLRRNDDEGAGLGVFLRTGALGWRVPYDVRRHDFGLRDRGQRRLADAAEYGADLHGCDVRLCGLDFRRHQGGPRADPFQVHRPAGPACPVPFGGR